MDDLTKRRLVHNEELFRQVNEEREAASSGADQREIAFVCECADPACTERITITAAEFERVRQSPARYIVLPGHVFVAIERIVEERGAFEIVEKDAARAKEKGGPRPSLFVELERGVPDYATRTRLTGGTITLSVVDWPDLIL